MSTLICDRCGIEIWDCCDDPESARCMCCDRPLCAQCFFLTHVAVAYWT